MSAAYDNYNYSRYWTKRDYEHESERIVITDFIKQIKSPKRIIDIGCGFGRLVQVYGKYVQKITLVDPSKELLKEAKSNYPKDKRISYIKSTVQDLPKNIKKGSHDLAICVRVFHHVDDLDQSIANINHCLDKKGYLILEFANKLHGKAVFKNFLKGNLTFPLEIHSVDRRSKKNIKNQSILFLNHHPDVIKNSLEKNGFKILEKRSVSNFRLGFFKNFVPLSFLLLLEDRSQKFLSRFNFGPSVFILAKKN